MITRPSKTLELDRDNRKFLGVCAGLANYLEVQPWSVRLVFVGCVLFGAWFLVPLYFAAWWLLDESSAKVRTAVTDSHMVTHFKNVDYRKKLYRNTQDGKVLGVCAGIADYLEVSVFAVRMVFLLLVLFTVFPLLFYFGAALVVDKKPLSAYYREELHAGAVPRADGEAQATERPAAGAAAAATTGANAKGRDRHFKRHEFQYCARKFANLQTRLARMEAYVTSSRFRLHREFKNMT